MIKKLEIRGIKEAIRSINKTVNFHSYALLSLGGFTRDYMIKIIKERKRRGIGKGRLERAIKVHERRYGGGMYIVGVGKISMLPKYWKVVDKGGYIPPATVGFFKDGEPPDPALANYGQDTWTHVGGNWATVQGGGGYGAYGVAAYYMKPKSPIRPMRYVQLTNDWINLIWSRYWKENKGLDVV